MRCPNCGYPIACPACDPTCPACGADVMQLPTDPRPGVQDPWERE